MTLCRFVTTALLLWSAPDSGDPDERRGGSAYAAIRYGEAVDAYEEVLRVTPDNPGLLWRLERQLAAIFLGRAIVLAPMVIRHRFEPALLYLDRERPDLRPARAAGVPRPAGARRQRPAHTVPDPHDARRDDRRPGPVTP